MLSARPRSKRPRVQSPSPAIPPADGRDILSSLPSEMLEEILRRLPSIYDVVCTSGLSKSWRRRWANCPGLVFEFCRYDPPAAVDAVLNGYACPIGDFKLTITQESHANGKAHGWIRALAAKGITSLSVLMNQHAWPWQVDVLSSSVFSCRELTSLVLQSCIMPPVPPGFQGFPNLDYLELREVMTRFPPTLETMISMSPSLTSLSIVFPNILSNNDDGSFDNWVIQAPNVKKFELRSHDVYGCSIVNLNSLVEAHVVFDGPHLVTMLSLDGIIP
ncbi:hypothetical protein QOZ80_2BG0164100 [Eleusine coracana subsp. coracana]|nr:hypothetical protein QOZ80_2BG0164100 [Eleusine coracana subsp. coracana]